MLLQASVLQPPPQVKHVFAYMCLHKCVRLFVRGQAKVKRFHLLQCFEKFIGDERRKMLTGDQSFLWSLYEACLSPSSDSPLSLSSLLQTPFFCSHCVQLGTFDLTLTLAHSHKSI